MKNIKILPEDKIELTQEQKNLIELAFINQLPPEDVKFIERVQEKTKSGGSPFALLNEYYTAKYGAIFGILYLAAVTGGEAKYKEAVEAVEKEKAKERISK